MLHRLIPTNGITLHTVLDGPEDGPVVLLLHGFPEFWYGWRQQIPALAAAGFRVLAPDQRGYNLSDRPRALSAYALDALANDALGLIDASGRERVYLVGHDWGAMVAWWVALIAPHRVQRLAILNVPHPTVMLNHITTDPAQLSRSLYAVFFQLPQLPERMMAANDWRLLARTLRETSLPGTFSDADLAEYRRAWSRPRAMTTMLNWYRALVRRPPAEVSSTRVVVPTTILWGMKDFALRAVMAEESAALCDDGELLAFPDNTHWLQHEAAAAVNEALISRFQTQP